MQVMRGLKDQAVAGRAESIVISEGSSAGEEISQVDLESFARRARPKQSEKHCSLSRWSHALLRQSPEEFSSLAEGFSRDVGSLCARDRSRVIDLIDLIDHSGFRRLART
jgi:hypothetical protein